MKNTKEKEPVIEMCVEYCPSYDTPVVALDGAYTAKELREMADYIEYLAKNIKKSN